MSSGKTRPYSFSREPVKNGSLKFGGKEKNTLLCKYVDEFVFQIPPQVMNFFIDRKLIPRTKHDLE